MAVLTWHEDNEAKACTLHDETVIGRVAGCDIRLDDRQVSRKHATIRNDGGTWVFEDEGSRNGSCINGKLQTRWSCSDGDKIEIGPYHLVFQLAANAARPAPKAEQTVPPASDGDLGHLDAINSLDLSIAKVRVDPKDSLDATRRLHASYEIARATATTLSVPELLEKVIEALFGIFDSADRGLILHMDSQTGDVTRRTHRQRAGQSEDDIQVSETALRDAVQTREAVLCLDTQCDDRFSAAQSIVDVNIRSIMIAPLVFRDQVFGAIYLDALQRTAGFQKQDLQLLTIAAAEVAAALANVELHEQNIQHERMAAIGETVAGLSHCIKNILQGIKSGSYLVDLGVKQEDIKRINLGWGVVKQKNDFMEELVWDLLTLSKPREPIYEMADLNALCQEICEIGSQSKDGQNTQVVFKPDPNMPGLELEAKGIRRALLNLVTNAVDACAEGGKATVHTHAPAEDGYARIVIRDTGCGMTEETLAKLFRAFFSTKGSKGTGLGLSVTKKIVEEHGGRLDVQSEKDRGTTFTVSLPSVTPRQPA